MHRPMPRTLSTKPPSDPARGDTRGVTQWRALSLYRHSRALTATHAVSVSGRAALEVVAETTIVVDAGA